MRASLFRLLPRDPTWRGCGCAHHVPPGYQVVMGWWLNDGFKPLLIKDTCGRRERRPYFTDFWREAWNPEWRRSEEDMRRYGYWKWKPAIACALRGIVWKKWTAAETAKLRAWEVGWQ